MAKKSDKGLIVALDVGTSKVVALVGEETEDGGIEIVGVGTYRSKGLKRGVVVNIEATVNSIQHAVEEAELMAGCQVHSAFTGIAGSHIRSLNSHGIVAIRENEVAQPDIDRVIDAARAVAIPADQKILHILPQEFIIDGQEGINDPIGISGVRLESKVHIVTSAVSASQNIIKCVRRCGMVASDVILEQLASAHAVLGDDEKDLGVCLVDIGGGTTDIAVYIDGVIRHSAVIPVGGDQVTNDIAVAFRTPVAHAEKIKLEHGCALINGADTQYNVDIPAVAEREGRQISHRALAEVMEPRYEEIFHLVQAELRRSGFENLIASGVVLTGGAAKANGAVELAENVFNTSVRLGIPKNVSGPEDIINDPVYSTAIGLLLCGRQQQNEFRPELVAGDGMKGFLGKVRNWFQGNL